MLKASKHEANLKMRSPLGSLEPTTLIGGRCTGGNVLSRAVLITRKLSWRASRALTGVGGGAESNEDTGMQDVKPDEYGWARSIEIAEGFRA